MKNIEKYHETKAALEAYNHQKSKNVPFDVWLECEYEAPLAPTLLESAEYVKKVWEQQWQYGSLSIVEKAISNLSNAVACEKSKPIRNCDKYKTAEEAFNCFQKMCLPRCCEDCNFEKLRSHGKIYCHFAWLYADSDKENT